MKSVYWETDGFLKAIKTVRQTKKTVFTNGCFDILHPGHIHLLKEASSFGDILIVGLNSDESVKKIKGPFRPFMEEKSRATVVSAVRYVDFVVVFNEETPLNLIKEIKPDVLVKGSEYGSGDIVGEGVAGATKRVEMKKGFSTTGIIDRIKSLCQNSS